MSPLLVEEHRPDLLLLQEATKEMENLPNLVGGHFYRDPLPRRIHGLAAWSPKHLHPPRTIHLPKSPVPMRYRRASPSSCALATSPSPMSISPMARC